MKKRKIKIGIAVFCFLGAGSIYAFFGSGNADEQAPDTPESAERWMCRACKHDYSLTARQQEAAQQEAGQVMPLFCPKCKQKEAWQAKFCEKHSKVYLSSWAPGASGQCPQCQPAAVAPIPERQKDASSPSLPAPSADEPARKRRSAPNM